MICIDPYTEAIVVSLSIMICVMYSFKYLFTYVAVVVAIYVHTLSAVFTLFCSMVDVQLALFASAARIVVRCLHCLQCDQIGLYYQCMHCLHRPYCL